MELRRVESVQQIENDLTAIKELQESFLEDLNRQRYDPETAFAVSMGFAEAIANAFNHGNQRDPSKHITVCYRFDHSRVELEVRDQGAGFDPDSIPDATADEGLTRPSGRGVLLMRSLFDDVRFLHGGRLVYLVKNVLIPKACAA